MKPKALIIGGGVIGCASALELAKAGWQCTLIDRGTLGMESSWAGAGILSPLLPWQYHPAVNELYLWSHQLYPAWIQELHAFSRIDPEYRQSGMIVIPPFDAAEAQTWGKQQIPSMLPRQIRARDLIPSLAIDAPAMWLPHVHQVRNPRLMQALRANLEHFEVLLHEHTQALRWHWQDSSILGVQTDRGLIESDLYVVCAGAWSSDLLKPLPALPPIKPIHGQIILFKTTPGKLKQILYQAGLYIVPRDDGHILVGSTLEDIGFEKQLSESVRMDLAQRAIALLPWLSKAELVKHWSGLRPGTPDNIPVIDKHPAFDNLYLNSGHFRYGVTLTPASAKVLLFRLTGNAIPIDARAYEWPDEHHQTPVSPPNGNAPSL